MSNDVSTQFPNPPELQPMPSARAKIWRSAGLFLTIGGLTLIGAGGWVFMQQQIEASKPTPRLLEVSVTNLEPTLSPTSDPTLTPVSPTATLPPASDANDGKPATASSLVIVPTVAQPTSTLVPETVTPPPEPSATSRATAPASNGVVETAANPKPEEESVLSLADNPLLVVEDEQAPADAGVSSQSAQPEEIVNTTAAIGLPLKRIVAESIGLDSEVVEVGWQQVFQNGVATNVWTVADYAAGWHTNSKLPGQGGNVVLSAHHNIKGEVFRYTVDLEPGDVVTLYDEAQSYDYVVEDKFIVKDKGEPEAVRRENAKWIGPFNEERLTLVTCWPYNSNTHRLIVIAKPVEKS